MTDDLDQVETPVTEIKGERIQKPELPAEKQPNSLSRLTARGKKWLDDLAGRFRKEEEPPNDILTQMSKLTPEDIMAMQQPVAEPKEPFVPQEGTDDLNKWDNFSEEKTTGKEQQMEEYRPLRAGETFEGGMPTLNLPTEQTAFYSQVREMYGDRLAGGKWSNVYSAGEDSVAKVFNEPNSAFSYFEVEFMRKMNGAGGLPVFEGAIVNGYKMEKIKGRKVSEIIQEKMDKIEKQIREMRQNPTHHGIKSSDTLSGINEEKVAVIQEDLEHRAMVGMLTKDQGQQLLDKVAEYHVRGQRVHGDLVTAKGWENIMITESGEVRIVDTEWEKIGDQTPQQELESLYKALAFKFGIKGLTLPQTISDQEAEIGLQNFKDSVSELFEKDEIGKISGISTSTIEAKQSVDGKILIRPKKS